MPKIRPKPVEPFTTGVVVGRPADSKGIASSDGPLYEYIFTVVLYYQ